MLIECINVSSVMDKLSIIDIWIMHTQSKCNFSDSPSVIFFSVICAMAAEMKYSIYNVQLSDYV